MALVLADADVREVLDATTALAAEPAPEINAVLELIRSLVPSRSATFNDMTLAAGDFRYVIVPPDHEGLAARLKPATTALPPRSTRSLGCARAADQRGAAVL